MIAAAAGGGGVALLAALLMIYCLCKKKSTRREPREERRGAEEKKEKKKGKSKVKPKYDPGACTDSRMTEGGEKEAAPVKDAKESGGSSSMNERVVPVHVDAERSGEESPRKWV